jgi:hypothetical protein
MKVEEILKIINKCSTLSEMLICIDNGNYKMLTKYKLYHLVSENKYYYSVYDDNKRLVQMSKVRFKKVVVN